MSFTFKNFFNKVSNDNRIFTKEDIKNMSSKEFQRNEKAIDYQMENLGIPTNSELKNRNDAVFVHEYLREDGTVVRAHYRSKPDGVSINANLQKQPQRTFKDFLDAIIADEISLNDPKNTLFQTLGIFLTNYYQMQNANTIGADKYFHAKANLESAQRGIVGSMFAKIIGDLREGTDYYRNLNKGYSIQESLKDIQEDLNANQKGRDLGRLYPNGIPYDLLLELIPKGFPDRYKKY